MKISEQIKEQEEKIEKLEKENKELREKKEEGITYHWKLKNPGLNDPANVMGIAYCELSRTVSEGESGHDVVVSHFSLEYMRKALRILEALDADALTIAVGEGWPLTIGQLKDGKMIGVVIAPRRTNE